jgi:DNA-binding transcriptional LysR family regulator
LDIVARHVGDREIGLYAATSYVADHGKPDSFESLLEHDIIGFDRNDLDIRMMRQMGIAVERSFFALRCDDQAAHWHLVRAGCGIGGMQCAIADADPLVERILPEVPMPKLPIWLAAPQALSRTPRMRVVWDFLANALSKPPRTGRSA